MDQPLFCLASSYFRMSFKQMSLFDKLPIDNIKTHAIMTYVSSEQQKPANAATLTGSDAPKGERKCA